MPFILWLDYIMSFILWVILNHLCYGLQILSLLFNHYNSIIIGLTMFACLLHFMQLGAIPLLTLFLFAMLNMSQGNKNIPTKL